MATNNSVNLKVTNNADGYDIAGGTTARKLTHSGADITMVGSGAATHTFPATSSTLARIDAGQTFTGTQVISTTMTIGTTINPDANDGATLGVSGTAWSDLFLASGAVINWDNGDMTLTQTENVLKFDGGRYGFNSTPGTYELMSIEHDFGEFTSGQTVKVLEFSAIVSETTASVSNIIMGVDAAVDLGGTFSSVINTQDWTAAVGMRAINVTVGGSLSGSSGTITGSAGLYINNANAAGAAITNQYGIYIANLTSGTNDYGIYIANAGTNAIWVDAGTTRLDGTVEFGATINPQANDGAALGTTALGFSDLFLASGGTLHFANTDWVATHTAGILTIGTGTLKITTPTNNTTSVVTIDATQTLTNKTIVQANNTMTLTAASDTVSGVIELAIQSEMEAGTDAVRAVTPAIQQHHPSAAKFWVRWTGGSTTILADYNVDSVANTGTGDADITITTDFSADTWCGVVTTLDGGTDGWDADSIQSAGFNAIAVGTAGVLCGFIIDGGTAAAGLTNPDSYHVIGFGDQ